MVSHRTVDGAKAKPEEKEELGVAWRQRYRRLKVHGFRSGALALGQTRHATRCRA